MGRTHELKRNGALYAENVGDATRQLAFIAKASGQTKAQVIARLIRQEHRLIVSQRRALATVEAMTAGDNSFTN